MKIWVSKIKYSLKRITRKIPKIIKDVLAFSGAILTFAEGADEIFSYNGIFSMYEKYFFLIMLIIILVAIILNWEHLNFEMKIEGAPDIKISLKVCDALSNDGAVIIPTNTTFDTTMEDEFISDKSLQGQYQMKYYRKNLSGLNSSIRTALKDKKYVVINDGRKTNTLRYPIGTVARLSDGKKRAYLVAEADINKHGIPVNPDASDISTALVNLWEVLNESGNMETYSIPILGTGRAGVKNASRDEVIKEIVLSFLTASRNHKLTENLIICVHPSDFEKIHWDELCEYITYNCRYLYKNQEEHTANFAKADYPETDEDLEYTKTDSISEQERRLLNLLSGNQMSILEIASALGLSIANTSMMMKKLVMDGRVEVVVVDNTRIFKAVH